jgi:hypothetical protein
LVGVWGWDGVVFAREMISSIVLFERGGGG